MANKIGVIIAVDGEREFRDAMTHAASAAQATKAELKKLSTQYSDNANSLEALTKKQEALERHQKNLKGALDTAKSGYENARKAVEKHTKAVEDTDKKIEEAESELKELKEAYGEGSDAVKKQEKALEDLNKEQESNKKKLQAAETSMNKWDKKVQTATTDEKKNSDAIKTNEKYLNEAKSSTDKCATSIDKFGRKVRQSGDDAKDAGGKWKDAFTTGLGVAAVDMAKNALGELGEKAKEAAEYVVNVGSDFEAAMSEVAAISGASGADLEKISEKAKELGSSTKFSATEAADAFKYMSLAGWDASTSLDAVDGIMQLAAASGMDLADASDMVTDYLSAFSMEASEATKMADMMAYAQSHSNTSAQQLGEAYGNCAAGLNTAGQSIDTVTALLEAMANQGTKGSEAGTALNGIMSQITQKMEDGAIQIGNTSVAVQDQSGNFRDLVDILDDVEGATDGMGSAEKSAALAAVFNRTSLSGLNQVLNEGVDKVRGYRDELNNSTGAAQDMANVMQDNLQGDLTTMNSALEGLGIAAYDYVDGPLRGVVQGVTDAISGLTDAITPQKSALEGFVEEIKQSNDEVDRMLGSTSEAFTSAEGDAAKLDLYRDALIGVAEATETTEFQKYQISGIVNDLADDIPELAAAWDEETGKLNLNREAINQMMDAYKGATLQKAYTDALAESQETLAQAIVNQAKADSAAAKAQEELNQARAEGRNDADYHVKITKDQAGEYGKLVDTMKSAEQEQQRANDNVQEAKDQLETMQGALEQLTTEYPELANAEKEEADAAEKAAESTSEMSDAINEISPDVLKELSDAAENMRTSIESSMQGAVSAFQEFSGGAEISLDEVIQNLESQKKGLENWSANMEKLGSQAGSGMSQALYDYLAEMGPESANLVQELVDSLEAEDGKFEEVSKKWDEALKLSENADSIADATSKGKEYAEAMGGGVDDGASAVQTAMQTVLSDVQTTAENAKSNIQTAGRGLMEALASGESNGSGNVVAQARAAASNAASAARDYRSTYYSSGGNLIAGVASGMRDGQSGVVNAAVAVVRAAANAAKKEAQIKSPSKKWKKEIGEMLSKGMAAGIKSAKKDPENAAREVSDAVYDAAEKYLKKKKKISKLSAADEKAYWKEVTKTATEGYDKYLKALEKAQKKADKQDSKEDKKLSKKIKKSFGVSKTKKVTTSKGKTKTKKKSKEAYNSEIYSAAQTYLDNYEVTHDISLEQEEKFWKKLTKKLKKGTQGWYDAQKQLNSVRQKIESEKDKIQSNSLAADEAYIKKRQYQGKMDTETELAFWKEEIDGYRKYSDEWYKVQDKITSLTEELAAEKEAANNKIISDAQDYIRKKKITDAMSEEQELAYWEKTIKKVKKGSDAWYEAMETINSLRQSIADAAADAAQKKVDDAKEKLQTLASVQSKILSNYKVYYKTSQKAEMQYWDIARKQFKAGTDERIEADSAYFEAKQAYYDELKALDEDYAENTKQINEDLEKQIEDLNQEYKNAVSERKNSILQSFSLFEAWDNEGYTKDALLRNAKTQVEGLKLWEQEITTLRKKNLPAELLAQLEDMGPEATASIYTLNRMTSKELTEWVAMWQQKNAIAARQAEKESVSLKKETEASIAAAKKEAQSQIDELTKEYATSLAELNAEISTSLKKLVTNATKTGEESVAGLIAGLKEAANSVTTYKSISEAVTGITAQMATVTAGGSKIGQETMSEITKALKSEKSVSDALETLYNNLTKKAKEKSWKDVGAIIGGGIQSGFKTSITDLNNYYATWETQWIAGIKKLNKETAVAIGTQRVVVDTGNIASILNALLTAVTGIQNQQRMYGGQMGMGTLADMLVPLVSSQMASSSNRSTRGKVK